MEKPFTTPEREIDLDRFYSKDPYEVLDVPNPATLEDINTAKKQLLKRFHPDINHEPRSLEVSQNINNAYDILKKRVGSSNTNESYKAPKPDYEDIFRRYQRSSAQKQETRKETKEEREADVFNYFAKYWERGGVLENLDYFKGKKDFDMKEADTFFETEKGKEAYLRYLESFIDLKSFNVEDFREELDSKSFRRIDPMYVLNNPKVKESLKNHLNRRIHEYLQKAYDIDHVDYDSLLDIVEGWIDFGIDLKSSIFKSDGLIEVTLEERVKRIHKHNPTRTKKILESFQKFNIKPSQEILDLLNNKKATLS